VTFRDQDNDAQFARLDAYLNGALEESERAAIAQELASDAALRREHDALIRLEEVLRASAKHVPAIDSHAFIAEARRRRAAESPRGLRLVWRRLAAPLAAAAVLALAVTAGLLWSRTPGGAQDATTTSALVTIERGPRANGGVNRAESHALVQVSHAAPDSAAEMGPPMARRTLIVTVAGHAQQPIRGQADEDAGYF